MKLALRTPDRRRDVPSPGIHGVARLDRRIPRLLQRLHPGDIAIIEVDDFDRATADALVAARVSAVINARPSISGRYPTLGPAVLITNGVPLLDDAGPELFAQVKEGTRLRLHDDTVYSADRPIATGVRQDATSVDAALVAARQGLSAQLQAFAADTQIHMQNERELLLDGIGIPELRTPIAGRHVLLVAAGYDFATDLKALKHYIREFRPIFIGVDAGVDVLRRAGYTTQVAVGAPDLMSDESLRAAAEVVVHTDQHGRADGLSRVQDLRVEPILFPTSSTSEDAAMLLAEARGARLIVTVGMRATLEEFLDSSRGGIASTVLTRLKVGGRVIDAKAAAQLYQTRISPLLSLLVVVAGLAAILAVLWVADTGASAYWQPSVSWDSLRSWAEGLFS